MQKQAVDCRPCLGQLLQRWRCLGFGGTLPCEFRFEGAHACAAGRSRHAPTPARPWWLSYAAAPPLSRAVRASAPAARHCSVPLPVSRYVTGGIAPLEYWHQAGVRGQQFQNATCEFPTAILPPAWALLGGACGCGSRCTCAPLLTSICAPSAPILAPLVPSCTPLLTPRHASGLSLGIRSSQCSGGRCDCESSRFSEKRKGTSTRDSFCFDDFAHGQRLLGGGECPCGCDFKVPRLI